MINQSRYAMLEDTGDTRVNLSVFSLEAEQGRFLQCSSPTTDFRMRRESGKEERTEERWIRISQTEEGGREEFDN